jgi:hypothetical protein
MNATSRESFGSFAEFYRLYLTQHSTTHCRRMHFFASLAALFCVAKLLVTWNPWWFFAALVLGWGLAWFGHAYYEKNHPVRLRQPMYGFLGEWVMFRDILTGRIPF